MGDERMATNFTKELRVRPGKTVKLKHYDADNTLGWQKGEKTDDVLDKTLDRLDSLQYLLYAEAKRAVLVVLQGLDAAGKDGTIRHVMSRVNPQGCQVASFKQPTPIEASHDFLWRIHRRVPQAGHIGIFNRSHYEDVLVTRVHNLVPKDVWQKRYKQINRFEEQLTENNVTVLKFFLHISKDEQKKRFMERIDDPKKNWKLSNADFAERKFWDDYTGAYEEALEKCSTDDAPWFVIPANKKWFRNLAVSRIVTETLEGMKLKFPDPTVNVKKIKWQ
jgi:PPK2 family polyphosphate:nucleotide phosphotransferase